MTVGRVELNEKRPDRQHDGRMTDEEFAEKLLNQNYSSNFREAKPDRDKYLDRERMKEYWFESTGLIFP